MDGGISSEGGLLLTYTERVLHQFIMESYYQYSEAGVSSMGINRTLCYSITDVQTFVKDDL